MHSLIEDVSALTTIPVISISQLVDKALYCICDSVEETKLKRENLKFHNGENLKYFMEKTIVYNINLHLVEN